MRVPLGWAAIALAVMILMLFAGANRMGQMSLDPAAASELDVRYIQHPWVSLHHNVPGVLFLTLAPLQFVARIRRRRRINIHRGLGRILATCAAISGVIVLVLNVVFPAFGGISTQTATAFLGVIFLFSLAMAIRHILRKEVRQHREWMIRTFALAVWVATVRVCFLLLGAITGLSVEETFGASFWLGFGVNLLIAEAWINYTRASSRSADSV